MLHKSKLEILTLICLALASFIPIMSSAYAVSSSTTVYVRGSETITIGSWDNFPGPLNDYRIDLYATPSFEGSNVISWSTDKDLISPGEALTLTVDVKEGKHNYKVYFKIKVVKKSTGEVVFEKTVGTDLGSINVPGSWTLPSIAVPAITFEIVGVPAELSIIFTFSLTTEYLITLNTYGLNPATKTLSFTTAGVKKVSFSKPSGLGAEVRLTGTAVETQGSLTVSAGLSLAGFPTPLKIDFATVPIAEWVTSTTQNVDMALLKTPISLDVSLDSTLINLGESITISGRVTPPVREVSVQVVVDDIIIGTTKTKEDGTFIFTWEPPHAGTFSVLVKSPETKYTTSATSSAIQLLVNSPPKASFTFSPTKPHIGEKVQFMDTSVDEDGQIVSWLWDFGDGTMSTNRNPIHIYEAEGMYTVRLTVIDNNGAKDTFTQTVTVAKPEGTIPSAPQEMSPVLVGAVIAIVALIAVIVMIVKRR